MDALKAIPVVVLLLVIVGAVWRGADKPSIPGNREIPVTRTELTGVRTHGDLPRRTVEFRADSLALWFDIDRRGNVSLQPRSATAGYLLVHTEYDPALELGHDIGAWASVRRNGGERPIDVGIRYSPARVAWGVLAPDLLLSPNAAGIGASLYLPDTIAAGAWNDFGVGGGWVADFSGGSGFVAYLALSHRF